MSTNPPQPPYQPPPPPPGGQPPAGQPPYGGGAPPPGGQPPYGQPPYEDPEAAKKKQRNILIGVIVAAIALIIGAFFLGQSQEKKKYDAGQPAYNAIYKAGVDSGDAAGTKKGTEQGQEEGEAKGTEQGKKSGLKEGTEQGQEQGINTGQQQGASEALGGLSNWSTDTPYIVEFNTGPNANIPFAVDTRTQMQPGILYKICSNGTSICTQAPSAASSNDDEAGSSAVDGGATP